MSEWKAGGKAMVDLVQGPGDAHTFHIPSSGGPYFLVSASALQPVADPPWREDDENTHKQKLEKALAVMIVSPWQPIETAPRDGTKILVFHPDMGVEITEWYEITQTNYVELEGGLYRKERAIFYAGWNNNGHHATHWQPLPEPPK